MKLNYKRTFFVGLAFLSICSFWQLYDNIVPLILQNTFHMKETVTGVVMALDNVLALVLIPLFGSLSDKVDTRLGKRTPFILVGTFVASLSMLAIPIADKKENLILFILALGVALLAMGSYRSPSVALMPDVTPKRLRSKANAIINLMGTLGGCYALVMIKLLVGGGEHPNYLPVYLSVIAIMVIAVLLLLVTVQEKKIAREVQQAEEGKLWEANKEVASRVEGETNSKTVETVHKTSGGMSSDRKRSFGFILASIFLWFMAYNAVTSAFSRYAKQVWGLEKGDFANCLLVATGAALLAYIPIGHISSKVGRKKTILIGILMMTVSYFCGFLFVSYSPFVKCIFAFVGIGWAAINVNSYPMIVEMSKNTDVGKYTGIYYTFSMSAQIITPIVSGFMLEHVSWRTLFPYATIFSFASFLTMLFVKHGDVRPEKKKSVLENFDIDD